MMEILIAVLILAADQITKYLTSVRLALYESRDVIPGILAFTNVHNEGAAWGMFAGARIFFIMLTLVVAGAVLFVLIRCHRDLSRFSRVTLVLIVSGAAGNLIDRVLLSYVRDMIDFYCIGFPVFNVADCAVTVGTALLIIDTLFGKNDSFFSVLERSYEEHKKGRKAA